MASEMETIQVGLLVKDATVGSGTSNSTVIVTANGQVKFTNGFNMATGMKFTLDQWNEIVNFVDGQLLQEFEDMQDKKACCKCG